MFTFFGPSVQEIADVVTQQSLQDAAFKVALLEALEANGVLKRRDVYDRIPLAQARVDQLHASEKAKIEAEGGRGV